jgi:hypothetical protein
MKTAADLVKAKNEYEELVTALKGTAATVITERDNLEPLKATFEETAAEKEAYATIKEIADYKAPAPGMTIAVRTPPGAPGAPGTAAPGVPGTVAPGATGVPGSGSGTADSTDPSDITFTFLNQPFTVESDLTGATLKPKQKKFFEDMNILPLVSGTLDDTKLLAILKNIIEIPSCKIDYGLGIVEGCDPMRSLVTTLAQRFWEALATDADLLTRSSGSGSGSGAGAGSGTVPGATAASFTTITLVLSLQQILDNI